ncbi:MAG: DUF4838 domain-containing protein [Bryobacterales bacterium]|nr:DUF4838 domain-containing protein [Bryobacteraceae bacterium]MDW8353479.1 DUF4838 domain-containing protein [Bryobacterales bacterium]
MPFRSVLLAAMLAAPAAPQGPLTLVQDGRSPYAIVLSLDASPSERRGAEELQRFLEEISGARLPIVGEEERRRGPAIFVGAGRALERRGLRLPLERLGPEGFVLKTAGRDVVIAGGRLRGTMYGVYEFLEKLGCRWFTAEVSRIPKLRTVRIPPLDEMQIPAFEYREPFFTEAFDRDWAARNRTNGHHARLEASTGGKIAYYPFVHSFYAILPPETYFKDHPEYFSLIAGKRRAERGQLCLTNADVLRLTVAKVREWIREHPEATIFSVSQNDWTGWCECDNCRRVEQEEGGAHCGPLLRFVNAVAAEIEKDHPDKLIDTLAYWYTEAPPARTRPRRNVRVRLCPIGACQAHPYERCDRTAYFIRNLKAWSKITDRLYVWHYNTNFAHYLLPFPDFDELAADIPMYRRYGVVGLFLQGAYPPGGGGEFAELRSYVMARLLWDVKADAWKAVDEFLEGVYGRAAGALREYLELMHRQVRFPPEGRGQHLWIFLNPGAPYLRGDFLPQARRILDRALAAADSEAARDRVRKVRLSLDYVELVRDMALEPREGFYAPADPAGLRRRFEAFLAEVRRFGITQLHEGRGLETDEQELPARLRSYGLFVLSNGTLQAMVSPELSGRIIRLTDLRAGTELLRIPDPGERDYPDVGGLGVWVHPNYQARPWPASWRVAAMTPERMILDGESANGLKLRRTLRLAGAALETETVVENRGEGPVELAVQCRAEFSPGLVEDPRIAVAWRARDGRVVDRTLFEPGNETSGSESLSGDALPDGLWRAFHRAGRPALANRFSPEQAPRAVLSWTVRGENRITLALWSAERALRPGEALRLEVSYQPQ